MAGATDVAGAFGVSVPAMRARTSSTWVRRYPRNRRGMRAMTLLSCCRSVPGGGGRGGELAAGTVDLASPGVAYGHRNAVRLQPADELALVGRPRCRPLRTRRRVQRDEIDVYEV